MKDSNERWTLIDAIGDLSMTQKFTLVTIGRYCSARNGYTCWYSLASLAKNMCASKRAVINAIKVLEERKLILVTRAKSDIDKNKPNVYKLNLDEIFAQADLKNTSQGGESNALPVNKTSESNALGGEPDALPSVDKFDLGGESGALGSESNSLGWCTTFTRVVNEMHQGSERGAPEYDLNKILNKNLIRTGVASEKTLDDQRKDFSLIDFKEMAEEQSTILEQLNSVAGGKVNHAERMRLQNLWLKVKTFTKNRYGKELPFNPSNTDLEALRWAVENLDIDPNDSERCKELCEFTAQELGEPSKVFNPLVRLHQAAEAHPEGVNRFYERFLVFDSEVGSPSEA